MPWPPEGSCLQGLRWRQFLSGPNTTTNQPRSWPDAWQLGMFIGSGAVEAGRKAIVARRLKPSGMRWTQAGATGILALRCLQASNRWEEILTQPTSSPAA
jgi:hypothetical protein